MVNEEYALFLYLWSLLFIIIYIKGLFVFFIDETLHVRLNIIYIFGVWKVISFLVLYFRLVNWLLFTSEVCS